MKKQYMEPTLSVVDIKIASPLLDASLPVDKDQEASNDGTEYTNSLSHQNHSIWDEEE